MSRNFSVKSGSAAKKLVLKNFQVPTTLPKAFGEDSRCALLGAVAAIHDCRPVTDSFEELYRAVEAMCNYGMADDLYRRLGTAWEVHLGKVAIQLKLASESNCQTALSRIDAAWIAHCEQAALIRSIFTVLDRGYVLRSPGLESLWDLGLRTFRERVLEHSSILSRLVAGLLEMVEAERDGETIDHSRLRRLVAMLADLELYTERFVTPFLAQAQTFYGAAGAARLSGGLSASEIKSYLLYCERQLETERDQAARYTSDATRKALIAVVEQELIAVHTAIILNDGLIPLLDAFELAELDRIYRLLGRVNRHLELRRHFNKYIRDRGKDLVMDPAKDKTMVEDLLQFKKKMDDVVDGPFKGSSSMKQAVKDGFEEFINMRHNRPAEMLAKFFDMKLRTGYKDCSAEELDKLFDKALVIFRFINGKDVFEAFYKTHLARRLLLNKTTSDDAERTILSKLKLECGGGYTDKLEGMFKDVTLSADLMTSFRLTTAARESSGDSKIDFAALVLTASNWPTYAPVQVKVPPEVVRMQDAFESFYCTKHTTGKKLTWEASVGHCLLEADFPNGTKDLQMSAYQGIVLLCFNKADMLSCAELQAATGIEIAELQRTLQSLACGKKETRVLIKDPKGREVEEHDNFSVNLKFDNKHKRIKINQIQFRETVEENSRTQEKVFQDRIFAVDASIVRIMKHRKTVTHASLMSELFEQLRFPAKPSDLKKRIESLIDREYIERDKNSTQVYNYMA